MSHFDECLWIEEVYGPPETREPGPADENLRGVALPARQPVTPTRTPEDRAQVFIAEGLCPCCKVPIDEFGRCEICNWHISKDRSTVEAGPAVSSGEPQSQPELPVDEYSPAQVEAA